MHDLNASKKGDLATGDYTCHWPAHYNFHAFSADSDWTQGGSSGGNFLSQGTLVVHLNVF